MRRRLDSLEQMVKDLGGIATKNHKDVEAANPSTTDPTSDTSSQPPTGSQGRLKITDNETAFVGPAHWESLVNEIAEIKTHLDDDPDVVSSTVPGVLTQPTTSSGSRGTPDLFFPGPNAYTVEDLLAYVPAKSTCDKLIAAFFMSCDTYRYIVHVPTFQQQYTAFWENPAAASPVWLAVLFDILALGDQYSHKTPPGFSEPHPGEVFHEMATHAVILADYGRPKFYLLEALILLIRYGQTKSDADQLKLWLQLGLVTRLATRMGMFRDAGGRSDVTPFLAEIRRRIWLAICHLDIIFSYQIGLVSVIRALQANTAMPLNLDDSDFSTQSEHLPPPRPASEKTFIASSIIMGHMILIFAEAVSLSNSFDRPDPAIAHRLNAQLTKIHEDTPSILRMKPLDQSFGDTPQLIMERIKVELIRLKTICVLFRRHLGTTDHLERKLCLGAALEIVDIHLVLGEAIWEGGQLESIHYQQIRDCMDCFILGGIVVGVELSHSKHRAESKGPESSIREERKSMMDALEKSTEIWSNWERAPMIARRAAKALSHLLEQSRSQSGDSGSRHERGKLTRTIPAMMGKNNSHDAHQVPTQDGTPNIRPTVQTSMIQPAGDGAQTGFDEISFDDIFDTPMNDVTATIDWSAWDTLLNTGEAQDPTLFNILQQDFSWDTRFGPAPS
ncbi:hypothetical protein KVT40_002604 [Elsinoe batatas]|uniref:Xylanolytic transcriptional activator regulatory domain-containing protein n=1 Tax=Elsinoe batatas TaxID=2601811 RepID=A0A8K0PKE0_9PEZI|nr:hypothetical protein KVT40_002604 [Elsinoe batatas]